MGGGGEPGGEGEGGTLRHSHDTQSTVSRSKPLPGNQGAGGRGGALQPGGSGLEARITGWRKKRRGGWKRAPTVVTPVATVAWDATAQVLRHDVEQFPGQAAVTAVAPGPWPCPAS